MFRKGFALGYISEWDIESVGDDAHGVPLPYNKKIQFYR